MLLTPCPGPAVADANVALRDLALRLLHEEGVKIFLGASIIHLQDVADGGQEDGCFSVSLSQQPHAHWPVACQPTYHLLLTTSLIKCIKTTRIHLIRTL